MLQTTISYQGIKRIERCRVPLVARFLAGREILYLGWPPSDFETTSGDRYLDLPSN